MSLPARSLAAPSLPAPRRSPPTTRRGRLIEAAVREPARPDRIRGSRRAPGLAVAAVCIGAFLGQLDASIVTVALPEIRADLGVSLAAATWVSLSYLVVLIGSVAALGRLADVVGRKLLYTHGFVVFALGSLGCALAPDLAALLACRVLQAVGAAMLQANSVALITTAVRPERLGRAIGAQGVAQALGLSAGPLVGGLLLAAGGWRWIFVVAVPAGIVGWALAIVLLPRTRDRADRAPFDWTGLAVLLPTVAAILLALSALGAAGDRDAGGFPTATVGLSLVAGLGAVAFVLRQVRARYPLIDPAVVGRRDVASGLVSGTLSSLVMFGTLLVVPQALAGAAGRGPAVVGLTLGVLPVCFGLAAPVAGLFPARFGPRPATVGGLLLAGGGLTWLAVGGVATGALLPALALTGIGLGLFTPANNAAVMSGAPARASGMTCGVLNMTRGIGTALGVAVAALAYGAGGVPAAGALLAGCAALAALAAALRGPAVRPAVRPDGRPAAQASEPGR
jgi:EmrB/QacA subfamily drug resistance transporter